MPPSKSPMYETGRERSQRIQLDYHRQRGGLAKWKVALALIGLVLGVAAFAYAMVDSDAASPGPVIAGHAAFEQDCTVCHETLTPMGSDSVRNLSLIGISQETSVEHTFAACTACHRDTDHPIGAHHRDVMSGDWPLLDKNCAVCHQDHQGRDHDLAEVSSQSCAVCHSDLKQVCPAGNLVSDVAINSFTVDHDDFRSLEATDPGTVTFDHAQHMLPGQPGQGKDAIRLSDLEPEMRARYRRKMLDLKATDPKYADLDTSDDAPVQLDCSSCHEMSGAPEGPISMAADAELGRYIRPISFDRHCAACHSMNPAGRTEGTLPIPHAAPWSEMDQWLAAKMLRTPTPRSQSEPTGIGVTAPDPGDEPNDGESSNLLQQWKAANLESARQLLKEQCKKCHQESLIENDDAIMAARDPDAPPRIPNRWLKLGIYDHAAHREIDCRYCHEQAYADGTPDAPGQDQNVIMIAGIETCTGCHRPAETATPAKLLKGTALDPLLGTASLWASDRCTMCHRYHGTGSSLSNIDGQASSPDQTGASP